MSAIVLPIRSLDRRARAALRPGGRFRVHSVFERALNLVDGDGAILGLVGPRGGNGPATMVLGSLPADFPPAWFKAGVSAEVDRDGRLMIGESLVLEVAQAEIWSNLAGREPEAWVSRKQRRANVAQAVNVAHQRHAAQDGLGGLLPHLDLLLGRLPGGEPPAGLSPLLRAAWQGLEELFPAWRKGQPVAVAEAAGRLVGLGPGQTPSGDDLLAGFMVAEARAHSLARGSALRRAVLEVARGQTTDLGFSRLRYAVEGDLDERSEQALAALLAVRQPAVEAATRELLGFGHSSGLDTLVGLLLGVLL